MSTTTSLPDKYAHFSVSTHTYKTVDGHPILVDVLVPKGLLNEGAESENRKTKRPVILRFHGGWLIGGQREFQPWWPCWLLDVALKEGAIVVAPDHRLIPEATAEDVLDDIHDFWGWVGSDFGAVVQKAYGVQPNLDRVLLTGESAGGYLALQTGLSFYKPQSAETAGVGPRARAVVAQYPAVAIRSPMWTQDYHKDIIGAPQFPNSLVDDHLASIAAIRERTGKPPVLTNIVPLTPTSEFTPRSQFALATQQHGRFLEILGPERDTSPGKRRVHPEDRIEDGSVLPPVLFIHGQDDSVTPIKGTETFIEHLRKYKAVDGLAQGRAESEVLKYCTVPGEHLFDTEVNFKQDADGWVKEAVAFVSKHWLE
ncbi:hypothetical protein M0805_002654 [Coniferiporia weirii]|nr:hypothetical protein M0805_002654 [Coniferiporia weirii]